MDARHRPVRHPQLLRADERRRCLQIMQHWFRDRFRAGTPTKNVNTMAPMLTLAYLYEETRRPDLPALPRHLGRMGHARHAAHRGGGLQHIVFNAENPQQLWDDTLMMCVLPLAKIGVLLTARTIIDEAKRQFLLHIKYLYDRTTGLWFHGWTFDGRHNFARGAVGTRQLLGHDRDSRIHRAARPASRAMRCESSWLPR